MKTLHPVATVHGRMLVEEASHPVGLLVGFHGYAQVAEDMLEQLRLIPGAENWTKISIQALHSFYARGDSRIVASWMTRQDRDLAIADNIRYVTSALEHSAPSTQHPALSTQHPALSTQHPALSTQHPALSTQHPAPIYVGFSQGAAMAYRAALHAVRPVAGVVALAGDIPPELKADSSLVWPRVLVGVGDREEWYTGAALEADLRFLRDRGIDHQLVTFTGGHEWTGEFRAAIAAWISAS